MLDKYIKQLKIGNILLKSNVFLGPMAGVTDIPFRKIVRDVEPQIGLTFTEMASSKAMAFSSDKTAKLLKLAIGERPSIVQIFGSNVHDITYMIEKLNEINEIDMVDINMGCPAPKIVKNGDGSALLLDMDKVKEILTEAVKVSKKPVTVKIRKGFYKGTNVAAQVAKIAEKAGVSMITVHGRTREDYYSGEADLDVIKEVKQAVNIPVIGNGDIACVDSAIKMFEYTGCDGIMISRGALGNPWIFKSIIGNKEYIPQNKEKLDVILKHIEYAKKYDTEKNACLKMRKHIAWYLKGMKNSSKIKEKIMKANSTLEEKEILIEEFGKLKD